MNTILEIYEAPTMTLRQVAQEEGICTASTNLNTGSGAAVTEGQTDYGSFDASWE